MINDRRSQLGLQFFAGLFPTIHSHIGDLTPLRVGTITCTRLPGNNNPRHQKETKVQARIWMQMHNCLVNRNCHLVGV